MIPSPLILTPDDQRLIAGDLVDAARRCHAHEAQARILYRATMNLGMYPLAPLEEIRGEALRYAEGRIRSDAARTVLLGAYPEAASLLDVIDAELEERFQIARAIRGEREGEVRRG